MEQDRNKPDKPGQQDWNQKQGQPGQQHQPGQQQGEQQHGQQQHGQPGQKGPQHEKSWEQEKTRKQA